MKNVLNVKTLTVTRTKPTNFAEMLYAAGYTKITRHTCANFNARQRIKM